MWYRYWFYHINGSSVISLATIDLDVNDAAIDDVADSSVDLVIYLSAFCLEMDEDKG